MKKRLLSLMAIAAMAFTGCTTGGEDPNDFIPDPETFYIKDVNNNPISGVDYDCDMYMGNTDANGQLRLNSTEMGCTIDVSGLTGPIVLYIGAEIAEGMPYACYESGIRDITDQTGLIEFVSTDTSCDINTPGLQL